jgi:hypothetical protein
MLVISPPFHCRRQFFMLWGREKEGKGGRKKGERRKKEEERRQKGR